MKKNKEKYFPFHCLALHFCFPQITLRRKKKILISHFYGNRKKNSILSRLYSLQTGMEQGWSGETHSTLRGEGDSEAHTSEIFCKI